MLDLLLPASGGVSDLSHLQLRVEAFITREKAPADDAVKIIRTVWFKPIPSDVPIFPILGPNSWFWLGAIVSSSFAVFLVFIGILTRYHIYPIDHKTNAIYSSSARAVLNLLFICFSIAVAASAAVLWNKRGSAMEAKQVQNMDAPTPATTPSSWVYNPERELESVPLGSLVKATNMHYRARHRLKKMLLEVDGSKVGVMASGPSEKFMVRVKEEELEDTQGNFNGILYCNWVLYQFLIIFFSRHYAVPIWSALWYVQVGVYITVLRFFYFPIVLRYGFVGDGLC
ncbi:hypothetical protein COCNU_07G008210 [Cocos nucifera]|uniref:Uncharacterized protein n=1 Tax=Cocos nucifera TaxID=13894 RepID=A0A8K0N5F9_COCNU|nr:hypothetical protein COCNU_07G008210 [Cocos nucifera]